MRKRRACRSPKAPLGLSDPHAPIRCAFLTNLKTLAMSFEGCFRWIVRSRSVCYSGESARGSLRTRKTCMRRRKPPGIKDKLSLGVFAEKRENVRHALGDDGAMIFSGHLNVLVIHHQSLHRLDPAPRRVDGNGR